jgi:hypothetical protein
MVNPTAPTAIPMATRIIPRRIRDLRIDLWRRRGRGFPSLQHSRQLD